MEAGFEITYKPARYEREWLLSSLRAFYDQALIDDVLAQVKGGKEASVYRCAAHPSTGQEFLAAKVYRPRRFRNLRNDKIYREGRRLLDSEGHKPKERDQRIKRAIESGSAFGAQMSHTSWLMHEFQTLDQLYRAGAAVPKPYGSSDNSILMSYIGDERRAAPTLHECALPDGEERALFDVVLHNVDLMLQLDIVHGDLSAYNILYWEGKATLIDFPQVVNIRGNGHAEAILTRDVTRVCDYFYGQGVECDAGALSAALWQRYIQVDPLDRAADLSRLEEEASTED